MRMVVSDYKDVITITGINFKYEHYLVKNENAPIAQLRLNRELVNREEEVGELFKEIAQVIEKYISKHGRETSQYIL